MFYDCNKPVVSIGTDVVVVVSAVAAGIIVVVVVSAAAAGIVVSFSLSNSWETS